MRSLPAFPACRVNWRRTANWSTAPLRWFGCASTRPTSICRRTRRSCWLPCAKLRLEIVVGEPASETPAARRQNTERERQERAVASIEQDPFVRDVVDLFDASIDESTIKPV
jgi:hypothetical protein